MIKYITVAESVAPNLDKQVNKLIEQGYSLYGGPYSIPGDEGAALFCQALTRDEPSKNKVGTP